MNKVYTHSDFNTESFGSGFAVVKLLGTRDIFGDGNCVELWARRYGLRCYPAKVPVYLEGERSTPDIIGHVTAHSDEHLDHMLIRIANYDFVPLEPYSSLAYADDNLASTDYDHTENVDDFPF